jgi:hypothetical protein
MIKVGVIGAAGRMGATVCAAIAAADGLQLVAAVDAVPGVTAEGITISKELRALADAHVDVAVDFTVAAASRINLPWLAMHSIHAVVGTTGFTQEDLDTFKKSFTNSNCLVAANFAVGAVLMMRFAEMAAPFFDTATTAKQIHQVEPQLLLHSAWLRPAMSGRVTLQSTKQLRVHVEQKALAIFQFMLCACAALWPIKKSFLVRNLKR